MNITATLASLNPNATFMYGFAAGDVDMLVGYQSTASLRKILTRVQEMHPDLSGETLPDGFRFTAEDFTWTFKLA